MEMPNFRELIAEDIKKTFNVHTELQGKSVEEIRNHQPKNGFSICLLNLTGDLNVGTCIRTAVMFGADKVFIGGRRRWDNRSVVGGDNYIDITYLNYMKSPVDLDYKQIIRDIVDEGYTPVICELGGTELSSFTWPPNPCIIMGNESQGIPQEIIDIIPHVVSIKQPGVLRSLNVSSAASIVMYNYIMGE